VLSRLPLSRYLHGKNDFAEESKILLDTDLKVILLDQQNNFVGIHKEVNRKIRERTNTI